MGHHNVKYTWQQLMLVILTCIRCLESFEEGAKSPSAQTMRDRLKLNGGWLEYFHECMWSLAGYLVKYYSRLKWYISVDETHVPFFGDRKKLNAKLRASGISAFVHGYRAKTPGATGSFCFLIISLCCCKVRLPIAVKMVKVGEKYLPWLEPQFKRVHRLCPNAIVLADRGFGKAAWFFKMLERLDVSYVIRVPLRKKESKNKVKCGVRRFQQWMTDKSAKDKVLLTFYVAIDSQKRKYVFASNICNKTSQYFLGVYLNRWDLENIFKDADRVELPTSSRNPTMRLFTVVTALFLFALWQIKPSRGTAFGSLRTFVKRLINTLCQILKYIITPMGMLQSQPP